LEAPAGGFSNRWKNRAVFFPIVGSRETLVFQSLEELTGFFPIIGKQEHGID